MSAGRAEDDLPESWTGKTELVMIERLGAAAILAIVLAPPALAQGDVASGQELARTWCTPCHVVDLDGYGADAAPPLPVLLGDGVRTPDQIRGWLAAPHPPMPDFDLSRQEIEDIVAYLRSMAP
jgi:mono/diheme cytochrome c family protein